MAKTASHDAMQGQPAPDFTLPGTDGTVRLSDLRGKIVVLYFYPRDNTPGCTTEACDFRDQFSGFGDLGATVLGVSTDSLASHQKFRARHQLPFSLLADTDAAVSLAYGVYKPKSLYGKVGMGVQRSTFVIDREGMVRAVFRKVKVAGHVDAVRQAVAALS
ncbi:MAG: peroxiredoxin [Thermaerobacter sp.]|nr:peroxiredoxin [Thermaerobacter sp.]